MSIYDKLGAKTAGVKARTVERVADKSPRTAPAMFLDATQRMDAAEQKVEELEAKLRAAEAQAASLELHWTNCMRSPDGAVSCRKTSSRNYGKT